MQLEAADYLADKVAGRGCLAVQLCLLGRCCCFCLYWQAEQTDAAWGRSRHAVL